MIRIAGATTGSDEVGLDRRASRAEECGFADERTVDARLLLVGAITCRSSHLIFKIQSCLHSICSRASGPGIKGRKMSWQKDEERNELCFDISANECFCLKNGSQRESRSRVQATLPCSNAAHCGTCQRGHGTALPHSGRTINIIRALARMS